MKGATRAVAAGQRGVAAVELGIVLSLLVTIVFGITELGRAMYQYDALTKGARAAARYVAIYDSENANVRSRAACMAVYGSPTCSGTPMAPNLTTLNVQVDVPTTLASLQGVSAFGGTSGTLDLVQVTISGYKFTSLVPFVVPDIPFGPIVAIMPQGSF
jgi:Flp pilus assembly protein TadG